MGCHRSAAIEMDIPSLESALISPREFVRQSGLSMSTVRRYLNAGILPSVQLGGKRCRILIPRDAVTQLTTLALGGGPQKSAHFSASNGCGTSGPMPKWMNSNLMKKDAKKTQK